MSPVLETVIFTLGLTSFNITKNIFEFFFEEIMMCLAQLSSSNLHMNIE